MLDVPEPLPVGAVLDSFTPDATLTWLVAYAGPCGDPQCEKDGIPGGHTRLYMIPMVGWLHFIVPPMDAGDIRIRPAIMASGGSVCDYLNVGKTFQFIAVLRATEDAVEVAKQMHHERNGGNPDEIIVERPQALSN